MRKLRIAVIAASLFGVGLAGCASTLETPLAPNIVRLDINGSGALFINEAMLRRAAQFTLQNGYSAFRLTTIYAVTPFEFGVIVVMFHAGDPGAQYAFDAAEVLKKHSW